ncbi:hypothetical protein CHK_1539 [Christensenella hongkongensis]|uniref:Uncharacterized protein n=1 Tax=Christensenella hongkongensis TaxID=270498 RepID=A0A0M2NL46_9FIRM|nr:hypothetical protein CHK_1539 [Christensenella hongkongensis]
MSASAKNFTACAVLFACNHIIIIANRFFRKHCGCESNVFLI